MKMSSRIFRTRGDAHGTAKTLDSMDRQAGMQPLAHEADSGHAPPSDTLLHRALKEQTLLFSFHLSSFTAQTQSRTRPNWCQSRYNAE